MSNNIALTASMRSNLLSLQNTQNLMNKTQDRLSTGYKVNSAMDNPSSYFTAQSLNSRANDLSSLLDSIGQAISTLEVADKGITTLQDFVEQAKSIANNARDTSNVSASTSSKVKFDTDTLRSELVTNQVNGLTPGKSSMTIRLGEATKLAGNKNVSEETTLSSLSLNTADVGTISVGGDTFSINASGNEAKMATNIYAFSAGAKFDVSDYNATTHTATLTDKDGKNVFRDVDLSSFTVTDEADMASSKKTLQISTKDFTITQMITDDGKTRGVINAATGTTFAAIATTDATAEAKEASATYKYTAASEMKIAANNGDTLTLEDKDGNEFIIKATDVASSGSRRVGDGVNVAAGNALIVGADGKTVVGKIGTFSDTQAAAALTGSATITDKANTIYVDNSGTVEDMAKTLETMIGTNRISVSVENSNLQIKSLDTSSLEIKGTVADKFGLDTGTEIKLDASDTAESLRQKIGNMTFADGRSVTAEFDNDGHLVVKSAEGDDMVISGDLADKLGVTGAVSNGSNERAIYSKQFDAVLTQIDELVQDTSYKGINLLKGDNLTVNFNESRTSTIELKGVNFDSTGLGFTQSANEWKSNADIDKALEQVTKATSMLRAQASEFGQNLSTVQIREDFTKNMINNLQAGADKLTLADMNEEAANMLSLQTRQQLGVNSLSLASQASQSVLKLF